MPVFFEVGLVLLMPIIAAAARRSGRPPILVGIPLLAGLSIVHGTLPPHPAAMLAVVQYHADMGRTILLGLLVWHSCRHHGGSCSRLVPDAPMEKASGHGPGPCRI